MSVSGVKRLVFKKIVKGDRRKFEAASNDTPSGGGARDLRFSPYNEFLKVFQRMLPNEDSGNFSGNISWVADPVTNKVVSKNNSFYPPTSARPNEGRLIQVHKNLPVTLLPPEEEGDAILVILQNDDSQTWAFYTTERSLLNDDWNEQVKSFILEAINAKRPVNSTAMGYVDYEHHESFYNGK